VNRDSSLPPPAALLREIGAFAFSTLAQDRFSLHDPLSVAVAIDRSLIETESAMIEVEFEEPERGKTRIAGPGSVRVATTVDAERALDNFRSTLGLPTPGHSQFKIDAV
jgi:inosine-uridine nucleoside N-ribohydrolase